MIELVTNRKEKGSYKSLVDFNKRLSRSVLNKRQIEKLILSNSFKSIHKDISMLFFNVESIIQKKEDNTLFSDESDNQFFLN